MEHSIKLTTAKSQSYLNRRQYSMREDETTCNWCWNVNTGDTLEWIPLEASRYLFSFRIKKVLVKLQIVQSFNLKAATERQ